MVVASEVGAVLSMNVSTSERDKGRSSGEILSMILLEM